MLHKRDGTVVYVNQSIEPAFLTTSRVQTEIERLSKRFGEKGRVMNMNREDGLHAVIGAWGEVQLEPLQVESGRILASGGGIRQGILVDFLGNFRRSAQLGLPVYRFTGDGGYVWSGSFDKSGRGHLHFFAIDGLCGRKAADEAHNC